MHAIMPNPEADRLETLELYRQALARAQEKVNHLQECISILENDIFD